MEEKQIEFMTTPTNHQKRLRRLETMVEWANETAVSLGSLIALLALNIASFLAILTMVVLLCFGFRELYEAIHSFPSKSALCDIVHGIEYFLLSPLAFLVIDALLKYVATMFDLPSESESEEHERRARAQLMMAKVFTVSLLAAAVATYLVGKAISDAPLELEQVLSAGFVLIVLLVFLIIVERSAHAAHEKPQTSHSNTPGK